MSTRSSTHFQETDGTTAAIVYRHSDGYPEGAGSDLLRFIERMRPMADSRIDDPSYLAARYVVFLASQFARGDDPYDFLGCGIVQEDPGDIEYRYIVRDGTVLVQKAIRYSDPSEWNEPQAVIDVLEAITA